MSRPLAWLLGLLGLAVLTSLCVWMNAPGIERNLQERTTATLDGSGFTGTAVSLSGRDVVLSGAVPTEGARAQALRVARAVPGVRVVRDELRIASDDGAPSADATLFSLSDAPNGDLLVRGGVSDADDRQTLLDRIREAFPDRSVQDELTVGTGTSGWRPSVEALLSELGAVEAPGVFVQPVPVATAGMDGATVVLRGRVPSAAAKAEVEAAAAVAVRVPYRFQSALVVAGAEAEDASGPDSTRTANSGAVAGAGSNDADVQAADAALQDVLSDGAIQFELATSDLTASSVGVLERTAEVLARYPSVRVEIQGHTDDEDSAEHNLNLSQQRAGAVRAYLIGQGIDADRLTTRGYGEDQPIASNDTADGRARNRRVVFQVQR